MDFGWLASSTEYVIFGKRNLFITQDLTTLKMQFVKSIYWVNPGDVRSLKCKKRERAYEIMLKNRRVWKWMSVEWQQHRTALVARRKAVEWLHHHIQHSSLPAGQQGHNVTLKAKEIGRSSKRMSGTRCWWSANFKIPRQERGAAAAAGGEGVPVWVCVRRCCCCCCCWANQYFCDVATQATANDSKHHEKIWEQGRGKEWKR